MRVRQEPDVKIGLRYRWQRRFLTWINRRAPPARSVTLDQRRIFIFPSRVGFFFFLCLLVMLLTAINYQNNMSFALTFLLTTLFVIAILHTYANLAGLTVHAVRTKPAFPGQHSEFDIRLERGRQRDHYGLRLAWPESTECVINLVQADSVEVRLHTAVDRRGWYNPGRLLLESTYPLGLLRCWTWVDLNLHALVYPQPLASADLPGLATQHPDGTALPISGSDDFYDLRNYHPGDSLRQLHWKSLAKGQPLQSKQYAAYAERSLWLDWAMFPGVGTEQRLSHLCYWALVFERRRYQYGLRLPDQSINPGMGAQHLEKVLTALALYRGGSPTG